MKTKKVYILAPMFISYVIVSYTARILPGNGTDGYTIQYGYPLPFYYIDKNISLTMKSTMADYTSANLLSLILNVIILMVVINVFIWLYKKIRMSFKKPNPTKPWR